MTVILPLPMDHGGDPDFDADAAWDLAEEPDYAAVAEEKAANPRPTGAMVAMWVPIEVAERLAIPGGERPEALHVTLAYLGRAVDVDGDAVLEAVRATALRQKEPLTASVTGVARFGAGDDGVPEVLLVNTPGLGALRARLVEELAVRGVEIPSRFDFMPHATLRYLSEDDEALDFPPPNPPQVEWPVTELEVALGPDRTRVSLGDGDVLEEKLLRRVRTPEGARRFGLPIGAVIVADLPRLPDLLPAGESAQARKEVPSVESLIAGGMDPEKAVAEHKRLHHNRTVQLIRARQKAEKAAGLLKELDAKQKVTPKPGPDVPAAVAADLLLKGQEDPNPKALYDLSDVWKKTHKEGPGAILRQPGAAWARAVRHDTHADPKAPVTEDEVIPVVGLTLGGGYKVEHGMAIRRGGTTFLIELAAEDVDAGLDVDDARFKDYYAPRLESAMVTYRRVLDGVPGDQGQAASLQGVALLEGANPHDQLWAEKYGVEGFESKATGGLGGNYWYKGNLPDPASVAHEFGHVVDSHDENANGTGWLTRGGKGPQAGGLSWAQAQLQDKKASHRANLDGGGLIWTRPGGHPITAGQDAVSAYGGHSAQEDFAESVRLYLKDHREGKLGYMPTVAATGEKTTPGAAGAKMDVRFADLFPERAKFLDAVFGHSSEFETPYKAWRKRQADDEVYVAASLGAEPPGVGALMDRHVLTAEEATAVRHAALERAAADQAKQKLADALEFAGQAKAAMAEWFDGNLGGDAGPEDVDDLVEQSVVADTLYTDALVELFGDDLTFQVTAKSYDQLDGLTALFKEVAAEKRVELAEAKKKAELEAALAAAKAEADAKKAAAIEYAEKAKAALAAWLDDAVGEDADDEAVDDALKLGLAGTEGVNLPELDELDWDVLSSLVEGDDAVFDVLEVDDEGNVPTSTMQSLAVLLKEAAHEKKLAIAKKQATQAKFAAEAELAQATADAATFQASVEDYAKLPQDTAKKIRKKKAAVKFYAKKGGATPEEAQLAADEYELNALAAALEELGLEGGVTVLDTSISSGPGGVESNDKMRPAIKSGTNGKAKKWLKDAGRKAHPKSKTYTTDSDGYYGGYGQAGRAKDYLILELSQRLNTPEGWEAYRKYMSDWRPARGTGSPLAPETVGAFEDYTDEQRLRMLYADVNDRIANWASTSGDSSVSALAMQHAVKDEFGLSADWGARFLTQGAGWNTSKEELLQKVTEAYAHVGPYYRMVVRAMYDHTQAELAQAGITELGLHRGMNGMSWEVGSDVRPALQPANSWSTSKAVAKRFGTKVLSATIPASRILGSARTGFGCLNEEEFVVLDSDGLARVSPKSKYYA